jgi:23S rRNA pseudouridine1911/1915/1917 synthase
MDRAVRLVALGVEEQHARLRLDAFLVQQLPWRSRRSVVALVSDGAVTVNGRQAKKSLRLAAGDTVRIAVRGNENAEAELQAIALSVLHEDEDLVVVDKPRDLAVHAASTCVHRNLLTRLAYRYQHEVPTPGVEPVLVHRLDRTTSGVIAVAKRRDLVAYYTAQFEQRTARKTYVAIVHGTLDRPGRIDLPIRIIDRRPVEIDESGKPSRTDFDVVETGDGFSWVRIGLHTGRKHQIRAHFAAIGHPLLGDDVYGDAPTDGGGPWLHAASLELVDRAHRPLRFEAPPPDAMCRAWSGRVGR